MPLLLLLLLLSALPGRCHPWQEGLFTRWPQQYFAFTLFFFIVLCGGQHRACCHGLLAWIFVMQQLH
jgi:hypothetical protein